MQDLKDLKSHFFNSGFAAANEHHRFTVARGPVPRERCMARDRPSPYDEGRLSAIAAPVGAPPYCIETRRALLPGKQNCSEVSRNHFDNNEL